MNHNRNKTAVKSAKVIVLSEQQNTSKYLVWMAAAITAIAVLFTALSAQARPAPDGFADLAERLIPAVVNISTTQVVKGRGGAAPDFPQLPPGSPFEEFFKEFFDRNQPPGNGGQERKQRATSLGSGFIIDADKGYVITNNHVIQDAEEITVILHDDQRLKAELVGKDAKTDLAVLKIETKGLKLSEVPFGDSAKARVGDWVVAIGNPFGLGGTVTAGIVSARGRDINSGPYDEFIQTDAPINRGNSGGPLFNLDGQVIGVNAAIYSPSGGSVGIGFAIPSNTAKGVIDQLIKHGKVSRGWLGVHIQAVTDELAESLGLKETTGALVASVTPDGPAQKSGIETGDVILEFNGRKVPEMRKLPKMVAETDVGEAVKVVVLRKGKKQTLSVKLGALDEGEAKVAATTKKDKSDSGPEVDVADLGLTLSGITSKIRERYKLADDVQGVLVLNVSDDSAAGEKGIRPGDLIVEVSQEEVETPDQVADKVAVAKKAGKKSILLLVKGQGGLRFVAVKLPTDK